jgi:hypothetical protein
VRNRPKWHTAVARQACTVTIGRALQVTRMHLAGEWTGLRTVNLAARGLADQAGAATAPATASEAPIIAIRPAGFGARARCKARPSSHWPRRSQPLPPWLPLPSQQSAAH